MTRAARFARFNLVSAAGAVVQLGVLWVLLHAGHMHYLVATMLAVLSAIAHNFVWHWHWTWRARRSGSRAAALARFAVVNGGTSIATSMVLMRLLVGGLDVPPLVANIAAISAGGLLNFFSAEGIVFRQRRPRLLRTTSRTLPSP